MKSAFLLTLLGAMIAFVSPIEAQVPHLVHYQGRVTVSGANFHGNGRFKFALVDGNPATASYWSNDGTSAAGSEPSAFVSLPVANSLYSVSLGDTALANMSGLTPAVFEHAEVRLRVWFSDGILPFERLIPDTRVTSVGYALVAESVPDGSITAAKLAPGVITGGGGLPPGTLIASLDPDDTNLTGQGYARIQTISAKNWETSTATGAPNSRNRHSAIWTGDSMIVWGGQVTGISGALSNQGGEFDLVGNAWASLPSSAFSPARADHTAIWTGSWMIVWGGVLDLGESQTGAIFDPTLDRWQATSETGAPEERSGHVAIWTGSKMLIWGGWNPGGALNSGGAFTPPADLLPGSNGSWTTISTTNAPSPRRFHSAVWTGTKLIVWGGLDTNHEPLDDGGVYDPITNTWVPIPSAAGPSSRYAHTAVWTGTQMLVFGGATEFPAGSADLMGAGWSLDPDTGAWTALTVSGAAAPRHYHRSVWTGQEMLVFGGVRESNEVVAEAGAFRAANSVWRSLPTLPASGQSPTGVWTGQQLLVFGSQGLLKLDPAPAIHLYTKF